MRDQAANLRREAMAADRAHSHARLAVASPNAQPLAAPASARVAASTTTSAGVLLGAVVAVVSLSVLYISLISLLLLRRPVVLGRRMAGQRNHDTRVTLERRADR